MVKCLYQALHSMFKHYSSLLIESFSHFAISVNVAVYAD